MKNSEGYIVIDLETSGLSPHNNRVVEIAAILLSKDLEVEEWMTTLLKIQQPVGPTKIHGISASDIVNAPNFSLIASDLNKELQARTLVAHNAKFEISFLRSELQRFEFNPRFANVFCTMEHARRLSFNPAKLDACCNRVGIVNPAPHTALGDAATTMELFLHFKKKVTESTERSKRLASVLSSDSFVRSKSEWRNTLLPRCSWLE